MGIGMGRHQRRIRQPRDIPKPRLVQMAQVQHDAQPVAFGDQPLARLGQPRPGIRAARKGKGHAMAKDRGPRPDRPQRPQPHAMKHMQRVKPRINRLGPLHMQDARDHALGQTVAQFGHRGANLEPPVRGPRHPHQMARLGQCHGLGHLVVNQRRQGQREGRVFHRCHVVWRIIVVR